MQRLIGWLLTFLLPLTCAADERALDYIYTDLQLEAGPSAATYAEFMQHLRNDELEQATAAAERLLEMNLGLTDEDPIVYGKLLANLGMVHTALYKYQEGLDALNPATEFIIENQNPYDESVIPVSIATGLVAIAVGNVEEAEDSFRRAQHVVHRNGGVYSPEQLTILDFLTSVNLTGSDPVAADQQQKFKLRVSEQAYGEKSEELIPILQEIGGYFARRGEETPLIPTKNHESFIHLERVNQEFERASELRYYRDSMFRLALSSYERAIEIIEDNYGVNDLRVIEPLKGLAAARMFQITHKKAASKALERVLSIVENSPDTDVPDRAQALIELADMYVMNGDRRSTETYERAWQLLSDDPAHAVLRAQYFGSPKKLYSKKRDIRYLYRTPDAALKDPDAQLFVEVSYAVRTDGSVNRIRLLDRNLPNKHVAMVRGQMEQTKYRPRMIDGEVVETEGLVHRQLFKTVESISNQASVSTDETEETNSASDSEADDQG